MLSRRIAATVVSFAAFTGVWWAISALEIVNPVFFPAPPLVLSAALEMLEGGVLFSDLQVSLGRAAVGFVAGVSLGLLTGLLTSRVAFFNLMLNPVLSLCRPIPAIALVPVAIVWFGIGETSKYFVIGYSVFLTVWLNTHHGMSMVADMVSVAASIKCTLCAVFAVTIRLGPPGRLLRSSMRSLL